MPSTVRIELDKLDFDWKNGEIVAQAEVPRQGLRPPQRLQPSSAELDRRFSNGPSSIDLPRVIAADQKFLYVPFRDTNSSGFARIARSLRDYVNGSAGPLPYPS